MDDRTIVYPRQPLEFGQVRRCFLEPGEYEYGRSNLSGSGFSVYEEDVGELIFIHEESSPGRRWVTSSYESGRWTANSRWLLHATEVVDEQA